MTNVADIIMQVKGYVKWIDICQGKCRQQMLAMLSQTQLLATKAFVGDTVAPILLANKVNKCDQHVTHLPNLIEKCCTFVVVQFREADRGLPGVGNLSIQPVFANCWLTMGERKSMTDWQHAPMMIASSYKDVCVDKPNFHYNNFPVTSSSDELAGKLQGSYGLVANC